MAILSASFRGSLAVLWNSIRELRQGFHIYLKQRIFETRQQIIIMPGDSLFQRNTLQGDSGVKDSIFTNHNVSVMYYILCI
jgi:hypothetical protein